MSEFVVRDFSTEARVNISRGAGDKHIIDVQHSDKPVESMAQARAIVARAPERLGIIAPHGYWWR